MNFGSASHSIRNWVFIGLSFCGFSFATTWSVNTNSDDETVGDTTAHTGSLPFCILNAVAGDTIDCHAITPTTTITLTKSLPAITQNLTITGDSSNVNKVTVKGNSSNLQGFSVGAGIVTMSYFIMQDCVSLGGVGGAGNVGGGGGAGGGGGLYVHNGVTLSVNAMTFTNNKANGGNGGTGSSSSLGGGGGGGFGGGAGGANGGGGGGGFSNGGAGGSGGAGSSGVFFGGGGGGAGGANGGGANNKGGASPTNQYAGGTSSGAFGGGGGAGGGAVGENSSSSAGAAGGVGLGSDMNFGGGGGGGGGLSGNGGMGIGGGGGGGAANGGGTGGAGGAIGGGGGGGITSDGGSGAFGGGGGGTVNGAGGASLFGGGSGGVGSGAGGGGGAGLGGAIFIGNGAVLNVSDGMSISGNGNTSAGGSGVGGAGNGTALGPDIFLQSGGSLNFNLASAGLAISSNIDSDQGVGGGTGGGVTLQGSQTLTLSGTNSFTGGMTILSGTLAISSDGALGASSEGLIINSGTLKTIGSLTSARMISLGGAATIDTQGNALTFSGAISGGGSLTLTDSSGIGSTVNLTGVNSYLGGTNVGAKMTLAGDTTSLQNNIALQAASSTVRFDQNSSGTYSGVLSGAGNLKVMGAGILQMTASSTSFTGPVNVLSGTLQVTGSLGNASSTTVASGAALTGSGTVANVDNSGTIAPSGSMTVNGTLKLEASSVLQISIGPDSGSSIEATGSTMLNGNATFTVMPSGFYGFSSQYLFLTSPNLNHTTFSTLSFSNPAFSGTVAYPNNTSAVLNLSNTEPFQNFPFTSRNRRNVGNNLDALNVSGVITTALFNAVNAMQGFTDAQVNDALNQLQPALYSALVGGLQPSVGGQLLSLFHRRPYLPCGCEADFRVWAVPMGNWLREGNLGEQTGYEAETRGVVAGFDTSLGKNWVFGIGGTWLESELVWQMNIGKGHVNRYLAALYTDFAIECFYWGISLYGGLDDNHIIRNIQFSTINLAANGQFNSLDLGGQFTTAYLFGSPYCLFYPYANCDFFFFRAQKFTERGADGLNLSISPQISSTIRSEAGIGLQVQDANMDETICVAPSFELGWAMECPIHRPPFDAVFVGEPFGFETFGWNHTFHLFTIDAALKITLYNFSFSGEYRTEMAPAGRDNFWDQRCNLTLQYVW